MGLENEAADEVIKIVLDGTEYAVRIAGEGAKGAAAMLMAVLQEKAVEGKKQGIGATKLQNIIRSGEDIGTRKNRSGKFDICLIAD